MGGTGSGRPVGFKHTEETRRKQRLNWKGGSEKGHLLGRKHSPETIEKMRLNHAGGTPRFADNMVFVENSTYGRYALKRRIIEQNLIPYQCKKCSNNGEWLGEKLVLELDHENGIHNDNRLNNLRFMCPNCHSQEPTNSGKNKGRKARVVQ